MSKQLIISIGREFGSGGHEIADKLANRFGLPMYDHNFLREIALSKNLDTELLKKYDEVPRMSFLSRSIRGYSNSPEESVARLQFDYLKERAEVGESFVIVGRCSETVLRSFPFVVSIFVLADEGRKLDRIMKKYNLSEKAAHDLIKNTDKKRKEYHNYYCVNKWGDSRNYDISINVSRLGIDKTVDFLEKYIKERMEHF